MTADSTSVGTIGRGYSKARSTEPFLAHPVDQGLSRLFTAVEHARLKGIPESLVAGVSETTAHEILGQSVIYPVFEAVGKAIGQSLMASIRSNDAVGITDYCGQVCGGCECGSGPVCQYGIDHETHMPAQLNLVIAA